MLIAGESVQLYNVSVAVTAPVLDRPELGSTARAENVHVPTDEFVGVKLSEYIGGIPLEGTVSQTAVCPFVTATVNVGFGTSIQLVTSTDPSAVGAAGMIVNTTGTRLVLASEAPEPVITASVSAQFVKIPQTEFVGVEKKRLLKLVSVLLFKILLPRGEEYQFTTKFVAGLFALVRTSTQMGALIWTLPVRTLVKPTTASIGAGGSNTNVTGVRFVLTQPRQLQVAGSITRAWA